MLKVYIVTGNRAEYGLLKPVLNKLNFSEKFEVRLVVTGNHLNKMYGKTISEIQQDKQSIFATVDILQTGTKPEEIATSMSKCIEGFSSLFATNKPDLILVLGDRFEILGACLAATFFNIPIAHLHGGEITKGAIDDTFRHSITKMSHIHFVAHNEYRNRVIQLGEAPETVHTVGSLGVEITKKITFFSRTKIERRLNFLFRKKNVLVTFHPETLSKTSVSSQIETLLFALENLPETMLIFTLPNSDAGGNTIISSIEKFVEENENSIMFSSLGHELYMSLLKNVDAVVGNSSSGIIEAPSLETPTVNIGTRQLGRIQASSIYNCDFDKVKISNLINRVLSGDCNLLFKNPYDIGSEASSEILKVLEATKLNNVVSKSFFDFKS